MADISECPTCGGEVYDNREKVDGGWKGPIYKCRDADCGWVKWPPKGGKKAGGKGGKFAGNIGGSGGSKNTKPLTPLYLACLQDAKRAVAFVFKGKETPDMVMNAAATLFIAAERSGTPLRAPAPKPAAPPPPPEPDEPEPDIEDEASALPF